LRWQFDKTIILRTRDSEAQGWWEAASGSQIIAAEWCRDLQGELPHSSLAVAIFQFLSHAKNRTHVAALNTKGHFIDRFVKSSDIRKADIVLQEYPHENGSHTSDRRCAQAHGAALLLCGDRRLLLIHLPANSDYIFRQERR